jgi:EmrB/QacA subfamily drug resistance transporter
MLSTEDMFRRFGPAYTALATATVMISTIAVVLSSTIINVAVPAVMGYFGIAATKAQFLSTGYLAATTATMLMTDWSLKRFGLRGSMIGALAIFAFGSILGAEAPDENILILGRVLQGGAAGIIQPLAMVLIFQVFPPDKRGAATGIYGIGVVLAPALGPWIGGLLIDAFNWRFVFYLGLPFAVIGSVLGYFFLPTERKTGAARPRFDILGFTLLCLFLALGLNALTGGQRYGWSSDYVLAQFAVSLIALIGFLVWEKTTATPLLDLRIFSVFPFAAASLVSFVLGAGLFGSTYLLPVFVQTVQGLTATDAGLLLMPSGFIMVLVFPIAGRLSDRMEPGILIGAGLLIFAYATWLTSGVNVDTGFWNLAWWTALTRVGLGTIFPALTAGSLRVLPREFLAQGSGSVNFVLQLGGALGTNLLTVIVARRTIFHADALAATQDWGNATSIEAIKQVSGMLGTAGLPSWQQLGASVLFIGQMIVQQAATLAYQDGFLITTAVFLFALLPTWILQRAVSQARRRRS